VAKVRKNLKSIEQRSFGMTVGGQAVLLFTLTNRHGMAAQITNYGGIMTGLTAPDLAGVFESVVLGYDSLEKYQSGTAYLGALVGRFGNRIADGRFKLNGQVYSLACNGAPNHLHGGERGFDKMVWDAETVDAEDGPCLLLSYESEDGEEGYPGTLRVQVRYTLSHDNSLVIQYTAQTDKATPVNLTHHAYFNLTGEVRRDVLGHHLQLNADQFTPVDSTLIPTGEYRPVAGTPLDFRDRKAIGDDIRSNDPQIQFAGGFDHNYIVSEKADDELRHVATVTEPESGRVMKVHSTEPGVQFYSGNFLEDSIQETGQASGKHSGFCLETQHFPDSPNQPHFPSTILQPGDTYRSRTIYSFSVITE
jgi:aldose 1-epimerase